MCYANFRPTCTEIKADVSTCLFSLLIIYCLSTNAFVSSDVGLN